MSLWHCKSDDGEAKPAATRGSSGGGASARMRTSSTLRLAAPCLTLSSGFSLPLLSGFLKHPGPECGALCWSQNFEDSALRS